MKILTAFILCFFVSSYTHADYCPADTFLGILWSDEVQACNRCNKYGLLKDQNCNSSDDIPAPSGNHGIVAIKNRYIPPANIFDTAKYEYSIYYDYCPYDGWGHATSTNCDDTNGFPDTKVPSTSIAQSINDCTSDDNAKYLNDFSNIQTDKKICLAKVSRNEIQNYASHFNLNNDSDQFSYGICAVVVQNKKIVANIGCAPYQIMDGPPPFSPGIMPLKVFSIPSVNTSKDFDANTSFVTPTAIINQIQGSKLLESIKISVDIKNNPPIKNYSADGEFSAQLTKPDNIDIYKNEIVNIGSYPRPALEQRSSKISFFPCYKTHNNTNSSANNMFQAVTVFSINADKGDEIGFVDDENKVPLYLGEHYIPTINLKLLGDINQTKCDLCINAAETDNTLDLYVNGYSINTINQQSLAIQKCKLKPDIQINRVKLINDNGEEITYKNLNTNCSSSNQPAPLRVNMFDIDEQTAIQKCTQKTQDMNYSYVSEKAMLNEYFVNVKPVIPTFDSNNEAEYTLGVVVNSQNTSTCNIYNQTQGDGIMFITPAGERETSFCQQNGRSGIFSLCGTSIDATKVDNDKRAFCPGLYQGPSKNPSGEQNYQIDKICIMSANSWDFISGRYNNSFTPNLNGDSKIVPKMSCTFLPGCNALGQNPVKNIGYAIWNKSANYNDTIDGECQEVPNPPADVYTYQYDMTQYTIGKDIDQNNNLQNQLNKVLKNIDSSRPYLTLNDLTPDLKSAYNTYKEKLLICKKQKPNGICIGGIYGSVKNACVPTNINNNDTPIPCTDNDQ